MQNMRSMARKCASDGAQTGLRAAKGGMRDAQKWHSAHGKRLFIGEKKALLNGKSGTLRERTAATKVCGR